jgi:hypothetical protein|tara:strand:- start:215 stop:361 length:147 start_codon:yes stop_codon:yes gene_type:complete
MTIKKLTDNVAEMSKTVVEVRSKEQLIAGKANLEAELARVKEALDLLE